MKSVIVEEPCYYRVRRSQILYFQREIARWIKRFGLKDWRICHDVQHDEECFARTHIDVLGRVATVVLSSPWADPVTRKQLRRTAFHEAGEILFARLAWLAKEIDEETHAVVRRLESAFLEE